MKTFLCTLLCFACLAVQAQTPYKDSVAIDINNIRALSLLNGDQWGNPVTGTEGCEYPKGSGKGLSGGSGLWISGYDAQNNLHVSAQTYRQNGNDYWPGPIDTVTSVMAKAIKISKWSRFWKLNKTSLDSFRNITSHTTANTPQTILEWPAQGNPYAIGRQSAVLTVDSSEAPYIDANHDGHFNALDGDYPDMKGDQMIWWVISDTGRSHNETHGKPLGIEIHNRVYAYTRGTTIDNVVYYEYTVINKSPNTYHGLRFGLFADMDLGYVFDDLTGFDSGKRMGYVYNATTTDGVYGTDIPMAGVTIVEAPGDQYPAHVPAGSFTYYNNDFSAFGNPSVDTEYNNLLRSRSTRGGAFNGPFAQNDSLCTGTAGDKRFVLASNDATLAPGASLRYVLALVVAPHAGGCPNVNLGSLITIADTAWAFYHSNVTTGIGGVRAPTALRIYPNPAHDVLYIEPDNTGGISVNSLLVYDIAGRRLALPVTQLGQKLEVATGALPAGIYTIIYRNAGAVQHSIFTKQ